MFRHSSCERHFDRSSSYIGSFNFTHSAFFRNYEIGVITDAPNVLSDFEDYFATTWGRAIPLAEARRDLVVDEVVLQTVGWQKVHEWWDIISKLDLREYNSEVTHLVLLPMPRPPLERANIIVKPVIRYCGNLSNVEVVLFSELYGAIPYRFADQFGFDGEYFFDEPADKFYAGNNLSEDASTAAQILSKFMRRNSHSILVGPLPENYKRMRFLEEAAHRAQLPLLAPQIISPFIGYMRKPMVL